MGSDDNHKSNEIEDTFIADLSVDLVTTQIKIRAPCTSEHLTKYNLLRWIDEEVVAIIHEYFLSYDMPELIQNLEELDTLENILSSWYMMFLSLSI